jgi:UDP-4-amino-4,6-dideoxy-N-acetyl-beta-L-altrosamine transaminase
MSHSLDELTSPSPAFLPYGRQTIEADDIEAVTSALQGDYLTTGPLVEAFEEAFKAATGADHAVVCNSGTAALHLAMLAIKIGPGDAVIVPTLTFLATANVVRMCGAEVVFADVDADTGLLTVDTFREALLRVPPGLTVRAAIPVHLNGLICNMEALASVASEAGVLLVEDACHALGARDAATTRHSSMACFSTHPVKAIATGEGGVVTTADAHLADRMRLLRSHGMVREPNELENVGLAFSAGVPNPWYYEMLEIGWNYRLPDPLCALGISQLRKLDRFYTRRREITLRYDALFRPLSPLVVPVAGANAHHGHHLYVLLFDFPKIGLSRRDVVASLRSSGIGSQVHYLPVHLQPYYRKRYGELTMPGAEAYYARCLSIPLFPTLSDADVDRVFMSVWNVVSN